MAEQALSGAGMAAPQAYGAGSVMAVTKSDTVALPPGVRGLWVGGAGNVALKGISDTVAVTIVAVPAGSLLPIRASYVMSTNTTATSIVALLK